LVLCFGPSALEAPWEKRPNFSSWLTSRQPAGVAVSNAGRIFVTFPRHTGTVDFTGGEVRDGRTTPFPNAEVNAAQTEKPADTLFSVQSLVIDSSNRLWLELSLNLGDGRVRRQRLELSA
jgi:hypothetical protein